MTDYSGMTVNERLAEAGLLGKWDALVKARDRSAMIRVLECVDMSESYAAITVDAILANPKSYGFE